MRTIRNDQSWFEKILKPWKKTLISVFRTIYNFKADCNKKMLHKQKNMRKRNAKITAKHNSIMQLLRDFDNLHPDQHISSLITTLKALGSL